MGLGGRAARLCKNPFANLFRSSPFYPHSRSPRKARENYRLELRIEEARSYGNGSNRGSYFSGTSHPREGATGKLLAHFGSDPFTSWQRKSSERKCRRRTSEAGGLPRPHPQAGHRLEGSELRFIALSRFSHPSQNITGGGEALWQF